MTDQPVDAPERELTAAEIRGWAEFSCWTMLALAPFLYWVNGPAVSNDQFVVRTALVIIAAAGAVCLKTYAWLRRRKSGAAVNSTTGVPGE